ncbi:diguanylate cyclase [Mycolicibacter engbaekii]|uniref:Diguanylate cyclase n=1 Tax=Mycolicibacter engbaekii TaxID=188915 RepID=A0A1X1T4Q6_9MYCO|nr:HD domain-containing protein [Mycolicibacter engbaekii]ORV39566.1 diguanylate cyclase [Mycolicibacter engbaekii]
MAIRGIESIADIVVPDTPLAREATELIRSAEDDVLFHHSRRVFLFGALHGRRLGTHVDLELLYVAAMFHDLGLTTHYRSSAQRFELDGADAARQFLLERGADRAAADKVWLGIALHTTPGITARLDAETRLLAAGVTTDVVGVGRSDLAAADIDAVVAAHPRPDFKRRILRAFNDGMKHRPETTFGTMNADVLAHFDAAFQRSDLVERIRNSQWPE